MEIKFAFDPDSDFQKKLDEVFKATQDLTIPLSLMAKQWYKGNQSIFALTGPGRYEDLSDKYKETKKRKFGFVYPILMATGRLMSSITGEPGGESINLIENKNTLILGTSVPYGIYHQSAKDRGKGPTGREMHYRPFLFVGVEQIAPNDIKQNRIKNWITTLDNYMDSVLKKLGK